MVEPVCCVCDGVPEGRFVRLRSQKGEQIVCGECISMIYRIELRRLVEGENSEPLPLPNKGEA